jgi:hypothetical protein
MNLAELDRQVLSVYAHIEELEESADQRMATQLWWQYLTDSCTEENPCIECQREYAGLGLEDEEELQLTSEEYEQLLWDESPYEAMFYANLKENQRQAASEAADEYCCPECEGYEAQ